MGSRAEVGERQRGERNLTGLRESRSQDGYDRQTWWWCWCWWGVCGERRERKTDQNERKRREIDGAREKVSWIMVLRG